MPSPDTVLNTRRFKIYGHKNKQVSLLSELITDDRRTDKLRLYVLLNVQSYQDDGTLIMKGYEQGNPLTIVKTSPPPPRGNRNRDRQIIILALNLLSYQGLECTYAQADLSI